MSRSLVVALVIVAALGGLPCPAQADVPVFPGVAEERVTVRLSGGVPAVAHVLRVDIGGGALEVVPVLAHDRVGGLETVPSMGARTLEDGVLAGVNGGFWLTNPVGDPNGYLAEDGVLVSESQTQGAGPRGTFAVGAAGALLFDRLATEVSLSANGISNDVTGINRDPGTADAGGSVFVYTAAYGAEVELAAGAVALVVESLLPPTGGSDTGTVAEIATGTAEIPEDGAVVAAYGQAAADLAGIDGGEEVTISTRPRPLTADAAAWGEVLQGLAAGPLIVAAGALTDPLGWESEGFAPQVHSLVRHPRTAVARTQAGQLLLVTVDGRRPGYSHGMTIAELGRFLIDLGAVDALSLDGGGSSQFVVEGALRNRPCCDANLRPVANGLFVRHRYDFASTPRVSGRNRAGTAAAVAATGFADGAPEVVLASGAGFADALAGGPLAAVLGGPLLLTDQGELPEDTVDALERLAPETVTVLGGTAAVGDGVVEELDALGYAVRRLGGTDRIATAAAVGRELGEAPQAFLAAAADFPDALTAAAPAGLLGAPVLLTERNRLSEATRRALRTGGTTEVLVAGGEAAVGAAVEEELEELDIAVTRLAGVDRYGTARALNGWAETSLGCPAGAPETATACVHRESLVVARGDVFADALAGGPLAAARGELLAIVPSPDVFGVADSEAYLREREPVLEKVTVLGGVAALSWYEQWQLDQLTR